MSSGNDNSFYVALFGICAATIMSDGSDKTFYVAMFGILTAIIWAMFGAWRSVDVEVVQADQQVQQALEEQEKRQSNSLAVSRAASTIVFVGDAQSEYGRKWLSNEAAKCEAKGWEIRTVDLSGMDDPKFFVYAGGQWKIHNGHLSLSSLSAMVSRTTATQSQHAAPLPSVAPRRATK
jgi:hypothetical protein